MTPEQEAKLNEMYEFIQTLKSSATIPFEVDAAFRERFTASELALSTKGVDTEDVSIDEGGASTKVVMNDPDGFLEVTIGNTKYYVPYFD